MGSLAKFFALFWGWADYEPKDWSRAAYKETAMGSRAKFFALFWGWYSDRAPIFLCGGFRITCEYSEPPKERANAPSRMKSRSINSVVAPSPVSPFRREAARKGKV